MAQSAIGFTAASPEMYAGGTREFSTEFIWKQEAVITEQISRLMLSSQTTLFATLSNSPDLAKFTLPPLKEKVLVI